MPHVPLAPPANRVSVDLELTPEGIAGAIAALLEHFRVSTQPFPLQSIHGTYVVAVGSVRVAGQYDIQADRYLWRVDVQQ